MLTEEPARQHSLRSFSPLFLVYPLLPSTANLTKGRTRARRSAGILPVRRFLGIRCDIDTRHRAA